MSSNSSTCEQSSFFQVFPNTTASAICGINTLNSTAMSSCCEGSPTQEYNCGQYCSTTQTLNKFVDCLANVTSEESITGLLPFCQKGITGNTTKSLTQTSAASRSSSGFGSKYLLWLLFFGYVAAVHGTIIPSLSTELERRQDSTTSSCTIEIAQNYTSSRESRQVSPNFQCGGSPYCIWGITVDSGLLNNNRTINGVSAAEPQYDTFFDMLQNKTGRMFPALSSVELMFDFVVRPGDFFVDFTPLAWCVNGTVTNCQGVIGDTNDASPVDVCGPLFVSDYATDGGMPGADGDVIQGVMNPVTTY